MDDGHRCSTDNREAQNEGRHPGQRFDWKRAHRLDRMKERKGARARPNLHDEASRTCVE
jgi:hypothetical protein